MKTGEIIFTCGRCKRLFAADGQLLSLEPREQFATLRAGRISTDSFACGAVDCTETAAQVKARERAIVRAEIPRFKNRRSNAANNPRSSPPPPQKMCRFNAVSHPPRPTRLPYREDDLPDAPASVTAREFGQRDFEASGAAATADKRLWEFFFEASGQVKIHNFNKWFKSSLLEDFIKTSRRMNNRAINFRIRCRPLGLELDNCMLRPYPDAPMASHYRLCKIEDALHLSAEEKQKILTNLPT